MSCINCGGDHEARECPELDDVDVWGDSDDVTSITDGVDRFVDEEYGHVVYIAYAEDGTVRAVDAKDLPRSSPGGFDDMIQYLVDLKSGRDAETVTMIDDRIAALRALESALGGRP